MACSTIVKGIGTILQVQISAVYTAIPQVMNVTPPQIEMGDVETTHLGSTGRERCATIIDPGTVKFDLEFNPANSVHMQLWTFAQAGTEVNWKVILPDSGACEVGFVGFIKNFGVDAIEVGGVVKIPVTVQVTGLPTITP